MSGRKKVKKKVEPKIAKKKDLDLEHWKHQYKLAEDRSALLILDKEEAVNCLKHYTKKELIGDLANPAIELLTKWGIPL